jgi:hypothetical protein
VKNLQIFLAANLGELVRKHCRRNKIPLLQRWSNKEILHDDVIQFLFYDKRDGEEGGKAELVKQMWSEGLRKDGFSNSKCSMAQRLLNAFINWGKDKVKSREGKNNRFNGRMRCMDEDRLTKELIKGKEAMYTYGDLWQANADFSLTLKTDEDKIVWSYIIYGGTDESRRAYLHVCFEKVGLSRGPFFERVKKIKERAQVHLDKTKEILRF